MTSFKHPSFQDRAGQAAAEKKKSLDWLRLRPEPDELVIADRKTASARRDAAQAEKAAATKEAAHATTRSKAEAKAKAAASVSTEADQKAARNARYAARQARNKR